MAETGGNNTPPKPKQLSSPGASKPGVPAAASGVAGKGAQVKQVADTGKKLKNADSNTERLQHGSRAAADIGKNAGGVYGAAIGGAGQGISEAARVKAQGGSGGDQTKAAVVGAASGAVSGALAGRDNGAAEATGAKVADKAAQAKAASDVGEQASSSLTDTASSAKSDVTGTNASKSEADSSKGDKADKAEKTSGDKSMDQSPGTGFNQPKNDEAVVSPGQGMGTGTKAAAGVGAVAAADGVAKVATAVMIFNYLKTMLATAVAAVSNLASSIFGAVLAFGSKVVGFVGSIGTAVSGAVGGVISATAASAAVVAMVLGGGAVAVTGVSNAMFFANVAQRDSIVQCTVPQETIDRQSEVPAEGTETQTMQNAKRVYGVMSSWGMSDENIAGILGNFRAESGIDPTSVQGFYSNRHTMTDQKRSAATNTANGLGLGQWTGGRNTQLRDFASGIGKDWWDIDTQLAFMVGPDSGSAIFRGMIQNSEGTPEAATKKFHDEWEISADQNISHRIDAANELFAMMGTWEKNDSLANSILEQANVTLGEANNNANNSLDADVACELPEGTGIGLAEGGLTLDEASAFMAHYKEVGLTQLLAMYPGGSGPGHCGNGDKSDNCVGFSTWFFNNFTSIKSYPMGNGLDTAGAVAGLTGVGLSDTPSVYSIFSVPGNIPGYTSYAGHTGVVLGIQGDNMIIGEANCGTNHARTHAIVVPISQAQAQGWVFADVTTVLDQAAMDAV